jgi:hypothetical protein
MTTASIPKPFPPAVILQEGFVAPRGVCLHRNWLITADTAQQKVFLFARKDDHYHLAITLGNADNQRQACAANTFQYPSGIWTDGQFLIVADAWNHRVLIWHSFPTRDYQPADTVVGQPDFSTNTPNVHGLTAAPAANSLYWPYGVWSDGKALWIADTGNRRVLYYDTIPHTIFTPATAVIGQHSFAEKEYDPDNAIWPYSVKISDHGEMLIADTQYYRCLYWKNWKDALQRPCDCIIGQPNRKANGQNQYRLQPTAQTLNWCYDACFAKDSIWVADTGNSRLLQYNPPQQHNPEANGLLGQPDYHTNGEASLSMKSLADHTHNLYWPFSISYCESSLAVADTGKSRIVIYHVNETICPPSC